MIKKIFVFVITFSLLLSAMLVIVGREATKGEHGVNESLGEDIDKNKTQAVQEIHDWYDLDAIRDEIGGDYVLMGDLDEKSSGYDELVDTEEGWDPIGADRDNPFTGTFDGDGHEIGNLYINRPETDHVGLFGFIDGGEVTELELIDSDVRGDSSVGALVGYNEGIVSYSDIKGDVEGDSGVGGLVGNNYGNVFNSYVTGEVNGDWSVGALIGFHGENKVENSYATGNVNGNRAIGGLVGAISGAGKVSISNSYATSTVNGSNRVGGLVGINEDGIVRDSYSTGDVDGKEEVGGLIGHNNEQLVKHSYARGDVSGDNRVGGLLGYNSDKVSNSYATGNVRGDSSVGGLVGLNDGTVSNSFWDIEDSEMDESDGGTGKTTAEMKEVATYTDTDTEGLEEPWDFIGNPYDDEGDEDLWEIDEEFNDGYPFLAWELNELTIYIEGKGNVEVDPDYDEYEHGTEVTLTADPDEGWYLVEWTGDVPEGEEGEEITITMYEDKEITALFEEEDDEIPGFTSTFLLLAVFIAVLIYKKKQ